MGKLLQLLGMSILPIALFYFGFHQENVRAELFALMIGALCFVVGWKMEQSEPR